MQRTIVPVRAFSTKIQRTPEQIKEGIEKVQRFRKFVQTSPAPQSLVQGLGSGKELHVPKNVTEIAALSGVPADQAKRTVVITQRMNKTLQSGQKFVDQWQIYWKNTERWTNPLMGWTSSADVMSNVKLNFDSKEAAIAFAAKNGWTYELRLPTAKTTVPAGTYLYKHNFLDKRTSGTLQKEGQKNTIFQLPTYGESHWFMPLKFHGDGEVTQHGPKPQATN